MNEQIVEALLELHYHRAIVDRFREVLGAISFRLRS